MEFTSLEEVITFAMCQEEFACQLYTNAAAKTTNMSARKMLRAIAAEEAVHRVDLSKIDVSLLQQEQIREPHYLAVKELHPTRPTLKSSVSRLRRRRSPGTSMSPLRQ